MSKAHLRILHDVVDLPTTPFAETHVAAYIRGFVQRRPQLRLRPDRFGNLLVTYTPPDRPRIKLKAPPLLFTAHMDHPGLAAERMIDSGHVRAEWRGGVQARYFDNERVKFFANGRWVPGRIVEVIPQAPATGAKRTATSPTGTDRPQAVVARVRAAVPSGSSGVWDLPPARIRGEYFHARACDDLAGVAAILCMLGAICRRRTKVPCRALFTRAEEVGFGGALAAADGGTIPRSALVVAVECSPAILGVPLGAGPVLRVGDKASVFTPAVTAYCQVVAEDLAQRDKSFRFQRKLMDGGTCESTVYCHYGYAATGICMPLANYHNMDAGRVRIAHEFIHVQDFLNLVKWFVALAESPIRFEFDGCHPALAKRLDALLKEHRLRLLSSPIG